MAFVLIGVGIIFVGVSLYLLMTLYDKKSLTSQERMDKLYGEKYTTDMNRFAARKEAKASAARTELHAQLNVEAVEIAVKEERIAEAKVREAHHSFSIADYNAQKELTEKAQEVGHTVETAQQLQLGKGLSEIKITEHERIEKTNLDNKLYEMQERVRLAIIAKHLSGIQIIRLVQEQMDDINKQIDEIERNQALSDKLKQRMIADREELIVTLKKDRNERETRLLEAHNGGVVRGDDLDAEL